MIPQWLSRLARRTYKQYCAEECEGREFDPPLGNSSFFVFVFFSVLFLYDILYLSAFSPNFSWLQRSKITTIEWSTEISGSPKKKKELIDANLS